ncbi:MAG: HEAT repeat domain-containing protein [Chlorobi bacterium]|nr:HEAT repeat domain-containing protein [Chlorobiota bacterium]
MNFRSVIACMCVLSTAATGQTARSLIERGLERVGMRWSDLVLPSDLAGRDRHRLDVVERVFADPLALIKLTEQLGALADSLFGGVDRSAIDQLVGYCGWRAQLLPLSLEQWEHYPTDSASAALLRSSLVYQSIAQQYLQPIAVYLSRTERVRRLLCADSLLFAQSDSLWLLSSENETADPYQLKAAEIRSDSIARLFFERALLVDPSVIVADGLRLYGQLSDVLRRTSGAINLLRDSIRTIVWETPYGRCAIGGPGDDIYRGDFVFIFDVGGNDAYYLENSKERAFRRGVQVIIDLSGDDTYAGRDFTVGAGIAGCGLAFDLGGNDIWRGGNFSLGCGLWGVGILRDENGDDTYIGAVCTQAAAAFGIGVLLDRNGNDRYIAAAHGQAFAGTRGVAILADEAGNDHYATSSPFVDVLRYDSRYVAFTQGAALGYRPIASGGVALLTDRAGNDVYSSDIYGQGTAYWFGVGLLDDRGGEDRYIAYQYAQGAGIHFAHGLLWDRHGNDLYAARGVAQGCGHDIGVGMLLDETGDDNYCVESLSLGGGNANALSLFLDASGSDAYIARNDGNTRGFSDLRRGLPMVGMFLDAGGDDLYALRMGNNTAVIKSTFGLALDDTSSTRLPTPSPSQSSEPSPLLPQSLDSLFVLASTAPQKYQRYVAPARSAIVERGAAAIPLVASKLGTIFPRERLALEDIVPRLYRADSAAIMALIADSLRSNRTSTIQFCLWAIGKCRIASLADSLGRFFHHPDWRIRAAALQQIAEGKFGRLLPQVLQCAQDEHPWVRARAATAIVAVEGMAARERILRMARDTAAIVRTSAIIGLRQCDEWNPATIAALLRDAPSDIVRRTIALCATMLDSTATTFSHQWQELERIVPRLSRSVRAVFYWALGGSPLRCKLLDLLAHETDTALADEVRRMLASVECPSVKLQRSERHRR